MDTPPESWNQKFTGLSVSEALREVRREFTGKIVFSTSLGLEDQVITDAIFRNALDIEVFTLDTGRNFPETYNTLHETQMKYEQPIKVYYPSTEAIETYVSDNGINAIYGSVSLRKRCCYIRKIEPLQRALKGAEVWITGLRAAQSIHRAGTQRFEQDAELGLLKFNPLLDWSTDELWGYIKKYEVPHNTLHQQGYASIGCAPCTRAISVEEDERAGRWWWEQDGAQECGLHYSKNKTINRAAA